VPEDGLESVDLSASTEREFPEVREIEEDATVYRYSWSGAGAWIFGAAQWHNDRQ
jgi:hypothetical protein